MGGGGGYSDGFRMDQGALAWMGFHFVTGQETLVDFGFADEISETQERRLLGEDEDQVTFAKCPQVGDLRQEDQLPIFRRLCQALERTTKSQSTATAERLFTVSARAGAGKSFLLNALLREAYVRGWGLVACASSGIAAGGKLVRDVGEDI